MPSHTQKERRKKELRKRKASNIAASLITSGFGGKDLGKFSSQTLAQVENKASRSGNTALALRAATALAGSRPKPFRKKPRNS